MVGNDFCVLCSDTLNLGIIISRYSYMLPRDGKFGNKNSKGVWSGIVREIMDKVKYLYFTHIWHLRKEHLTKLA